MDNFLHLFMFAVLLYVLPSNGIPQRKLRFKHYKEVLDSNDANRTEQVFTVPQPMRCDVTSCVDKEGVFPLTDMSFEGAENYFLHCTGSMMSSVCKQCPGDAFFNPNCLMCMEEEMKNTTDCPDQMNVTTTAAPEPLPVCSRSGEMQCRMNGPEFNGTRADPMNRSRFAACYMGEFVACMWCPKAFDMNGDLRRLMHNDEMGACLFGGDLIYRDQFVNN